MQSLRAQVAAASGGSGAGDEASAARARRAARKRSKEKHIEAVAAYKRAILTLMPAARAHSEAGRWAAADAAFAQAARELPNHMRWAHNHLAQARAESLVQRHSYPAALAALTALVKAEPRATRALVWLGDVLAQLGRTDEAKARYAQAAAADASAVPVGENDIGLSTA